MTPEQLTEIPGIGEKMVEKIQLSVAAYFQSLENAPPETESLEAQGEQELASEDAADVQAEDIEAPTEAEEIVADEQAQNENADAGPGESPEDPDENGNK